MDYQELFEDETGIKQRENFDNKHYWMAYALWLENHLAEACKTLEWYADFNMWKCDDRGRDCIFSESLDEKGVGRGTEPAKDFLEKLKEVKE